MKKWEFTDELSSIAPEEIEENASIFGNYCFGVTEKQLEELKAGRVLFDTGEYGIFFALVDEHPAEVKRKKEGKPMEREAAEKTIKSALAEIAEKFSLERNPLTFTEENLQRLNDECARLVRRYVEAGEIVIWPIDNGISIYNAPMDILPFIPLCGGLGVKEYGTYTVMRGLQTLGRVTYSGRPTQDKPGTAFLGVKASYVPKEAVPKITFTLEIDEEYRRLLGDLIKEGST